MTTNPMATPAGGATHPARTTTANETARKSRWGLNRLLVVLGAALPLVAPLAIFGFEAILFLGPLLIPSLVALVLILIWSRPWTYLTAAIVGSLFPLFAIVMLGLMAGFLDPLDPMGFLLFLTIFAALVLLWTGGVQGFRQARHGEPPRHPLATRHVMQRLVILFLVGLLLGGAATSFAAASRTMEIAGGGYDFVPDERIEVTMQNFAFAPEDITVGQGVITEIFIENRDREIHTFTYEKDGVEYNHEFLAGQSSGFLVLFPESGTYVYWCKPHSGQENGEWEGMIGSIIVAPTTVTAGGSV